jgi:chromosome segregation ATPase
MSAFAIFAIPKITKVTAVRFSAPVAEENNSSGSSQDKADELSMEIDDLQWLLEKKKSELEEIRINRQLADSAAVQVDMIQDSMNLLETRIINCAKQLASLKPIALELDELEINYNQLKNELAQSQHNYQSSLSENELLREELELLKEEASYLAIEKAQLNKKIILLESINHDLETTIEAMKGSLAF